MTAAASLLLADSGPVVNFTVQARVVAAVLALLFLGFILELIRRDRLTERYSIVWFLLGFLMLIGAAFPGLLGLLAELIGVRDVTIALFSVILLLLLALSLSFSVIASRQSRQITRLAQRDALDTIREPANDPPPEQAGPEADPVRSGSNRPGP